MVEGVSRSADSLDTAWQIARHRAAIDAAVASMYDLSLLQLAAVLSTFPNVDKTQPMLPGEPRSFVTRDLVLQAFCQLTDARSPDVAKLMREVGAGSSDPLPEFRDLETRVSEYFKLGSIPYRPTPMGGRLPTDPALVEEMLGVLRDDALTAEEIADAVDSEEYLVRKVLGALRKSGDVYVDGRGKNARYYVVGDD